jgi:hypothetical protein
MSQDWLQRHQTYSNPSNSQFQQNNQVQQQFQVTMQSEPRWLASLSLGAVARPFPKFRAVQTLNRRDQD